MNESLDISRVAEELSAAGIHSSLTKRLAEAVRTRGVAAVPSLGAFADWQTMRAVNTFIGSAFDAGATRQELSDQLEVAAQLQDVMGQVVWALADRRTVGR